MNSSISVTFTEFALFFKINSFPSNNPSESSSGTYVKIVLLKLLAKFFLNKKNKRRHEMSLYFIMRC